MSTVREATLAGSVVEDLRRAELTYVEVGSTRGTLPTGYHHVRRTVVVGSGKEHFDKVTGTVLGWDMHRRAGLVVRPSSESVTQQAVAVLRLGWGPVGVDAPVRVVYVIDEPHRQGFAYGTLPGHPETGEEAFVVELHDGGGVTFTIRAFSRPATPATRVTGPIGRAIQSWVTTRYVRAVSWH
jgi:uncharacterized protein (UPF0548 family)